MDIVQDIVQNGGEMPKWDVTFDIRLQTTHPSVIDCLSRARAYSSVIRNIPITPRTKRKIDALNILRAVRGTTGIEGTELTEKEVRQIMEAAPGNNVLPQNRSREEQEARNAQQLMYYVVDTLLQTPDSPLTEELIRKIHQITTKEINYPHNVPGNYRTHPVAAGGYVPPMSGEEVAKLMEAFIKWFNEGEPARWDPIIRAIVAHFYVVSIHPFGDGNGRTARGVESLLLYQSGINARGFYSLANFYYRNREEYVQTLDHVRFQTNGDLTPFVLFALQGLVEELESLHSEVIAEVQVISFRDYVREELEVNGKIGTKAGERILHLALELGTEPVSLRALRSGKHPLSRLYKNVTPKTLSRDIAFLKSRELIIIDGDNMIANLDVMNRYTPPFEFQLRPVASTQQKPK